jgi:hypothetical protein
MAENIQQSGSGVGVVFVAQKLNSSVNIAMRLGQSGSRGRIAVFSVQNNSCGEEPLGVAQLAAERRTSGGAQ